MPHPHELRLGTRGSHLALWQANAVASRIAADGGPRCRLVIIKTSGDRLQDAPLSAVGGKRLFVKELEDALLKGEIDLAVHSSKDMPAVLPDGLTIAAVLPREDPLDAVVLPVAGSAPALDHAPDPNAAAASGTPALHPALATIEIRTGDETTRGIVARIDDPPARAALTAERALVAALGGGCQTPIGALATAAGADTIALVAVVVALDGSRAVRKQARGANHDAAGLGASVGAALLADGADEILAEASRVQGAVEGIQP